MIDFSLCVYNVRVVVVELGLGRSLNGTISSPHFTPCVSLRGVTARCICGRRGVCTLGALEGVRFHQKQEQASLLVFDVGRAEQTQLR